MMIVALLSHFFAKRCDAGEFASVVAEAVVNLVSDDVNIVTQADLRKRFQLFFSSRSCRSGWTGC